MDFFFLQTWLRKVQLSGASRGVRWFWNRLLGGQALGVLGAGQQGHPAARVGRRPSYIQGSQGAGEEADWRGSLQGTLGVEGLSHLMKRSPSVNVFLRKLRCSPDSQKAKL